MNFWIPPQSQELQARTKLFHTARGITYHITRPVDTHPLAFSWALGLRNLQWYSSPPAPLSLYVREEFLIAIAGHWRKPLTSLDMNMLATRMGCVPAREQATLIRLINSQLLLPKEFRMKDIEHSIPMDVMDRLTVALSNLETSLLEKDPMMPQHLRNTHSLLITYPETTHLLEDSEIAMLIDAAEIHTKTEIVKATVKKGTGTRKKIDIGDL